MTRGPAHKCYDGDLSVGTKVNADDRVNADSVVNRDYGFEVTRTSLHLIDFDYCWDFVLLEDLGDVRVT